VCKAQEYQPKPQVEDAHANVVFPRHAINQMVYIYPWWSKAVKFGT